MIDIDKVSQQVRQIVQDKKNSLQAAYVNKFLQSIVYQLNLFDTVAGCNMTDIQHRDERYAQYNLQDMFVITDTGLSIQRPVDMSDYLWGNITDIYYSNAKRRTFKGSALS